MSARPKVMKSTRTEKEVTNQVVEAAAMLGIELKRRNVGGMTNAKGQYVSFGEPGDADRYAILPGGKHLDIEIKHEGFDPSKLRGEKKAHFDRQLARLRKTNADGGIGFFCDNSLVFVKVMQIVLNGGWVELEGDGQLIVYDPDIKE
jgi:hypothetical protein